MPPGTGRFLIVLGLCIAGLGVLLSMGGQVPWLGRLPGDLSFRRGGFSFYFPLTTSILVSVVLTLVLRFFHR